MAQTKRKKKTKKRSCIICCNPCPFFPVASRRQTVNCFETYFLSNATLLAYRTLHCTQPQGGLAVKSSTFFTHTPTELAPDGSLPLIVSTRVCFGCFVCVCVLFPHPNHACMQATKIVCIDAKAHTPPTQTIVRASGGEGGEREKRGIVKEGDNNTKVPCQGRR